MLGCFLYRLAGNSRQRQPKTEVNKHFLSARPRPLPQSQEQGLAQPNRLSCNVLQMSDCDMSSSVPIRAAGFIIFRLSPTKVSEYLLLQASYGQHHWTPPKGHVDPGEDDWQTAVRETCEEAGLSAEKDLKVIEDFKVEMNYEVQRRGKLQKKLVTYWLARLITSTSVTLSDEHQDFRWASLEDACKLSGYEDMNKALRECEEKIRQE